MSNWRLTAESSIYKEALKATYSIEEPSLGFVKPEDVTRHTTSVLIKQNNTLLQLLVQVCQEVEDLKQDVKHLKAAKQKVPDSDDLTTSLAELQKGLQNLKLGESSKQSVPKTTGKFYVFKNPKDIFDSVRNQK